MSDLPKIKTYIYVDNATQLAIHYDGRVIKGPLVIARIEAESIEEADRKLAHQSNIACISYPKEKKK